MQYDNGKPVGCTKVVVSTQHNEKSRNNKKYTPGLIKEMIGTAVESALPKGWMPKSKSDFLVNPTGNFVIGGPDGDCGLTGRKIIVDTYGGCGPARRRRVLRQGPDQGRSLGGLCGALSRQERGGRGPRRPLHHPGRLRDRRRRADVGAGRHPRHRQGRREAKLEKAAAGNLPAARRPASAAPQAEPADLPPHRRLRSLRPRARTRTAASPGSRPTWSTQIKSALK